MVWYGTVWMGGLEGEGDWGLRGRDRLLILYIVLCLVFLFSDGRCCELSGVGVVVACTVQLIEEAQRDMAAFGDCRVWNVVSMDGNGGS